MEKGNIKENRHLVDLVIQQVLAFYVPLDFVYIGTEADRAKRL